MVFMSNKIAVGQEMFLMKVFSPEAIVLWLLGKDISAPELSTGRQKQFWCEW